MDTIESRRRLEMGRKQRWADTEAANREANRDLALLLVIFVLGIMIGIALATFARIVI